MLLFLGLIRIAFNGSGYFLRLELIGLLFLLLLALIGFIGYKKCWGESVLLLVFLAYLGNLVAIWFYLHQTYLLLTLLAALGFVLATVQGRPERKKVAEEQPSSIIIEEPKTNFSPGRYVASSRSNIYHEPRCDWAAKIEPSRRVWFDSKEEAWEKGFKKHTCVV